MRQDIADIEFRKDENGEEKFVSRGIEAKDSNYIVSHTGEHFYPSCFNRLVNELNEICDGNIVEIKVFERSQAALEVQLILKDRSGQDSIRDATRKLLIGKMGNEMQYEIKFVELVHHDYRKKYRVIERIRYEEYAGGIVGNTGR